MAKTIQHPSAGRLSVDIEILTAPQEPEQRLVIDATDPNSPTDRVLALLASWELGDRAQAPGR